MKFEDQVKQAMVNQIISSGYNDRMEKIAKDGIDDIANIQYADVLQTGRGANGELTKQAADEVVTREMRRQIVLSGYLDSIN